MHIGKTFVTLLLAAAFCIAAQPPSVLASGEPETVLHAEEAAPAAEPDAGGELDTEEPAPEYIESEPEQPAPPEAAAEETEAELPFDGAAANEALVFAFLTGTLGYNAAAACGVMANIAAESSFNPSVYGDGGTSYGICQWHDWGDGVGRFTNLKKFCADNGLDYTTLEGQLNFLRYELENSYTGINRYMKQSIPNTSQGAYTAGWYWCYYFEVPANREAVSVTRGNAASGAYWPRYAVSCTVSFDADGGTAVQSLTVAVGGAIGTLPSTQRVGYTFGGWYTQKNGGGSRLTPAAVINESMTVYASWNANLILVSFDANGGAVGTAEKNVYYDGTYGELPTPARTGFSFDGWYMAPEGGALVTASSTVTNPDMHTLYAHWISDTKYTVAYNANGGSGAPMPQTKTHGTALTILSTVPKRANYTFLGWAESASARAADYKPGASYTADKSVTLYAVWQYVFALGDMDGDGRLTAADAAIVLSRTGKNEPGADRDGDGSVTVFDAALILQESVGRSTKV